ncbi:MAG: YbaB/EbfC family nucleoid-associated protein [Verrucomicrobia bacterium]|nr:YbaB/EbfC family nucleoid-associated protein [Verrucomicrobiota bacterium]MDE3047497.1 YbaB/EbfC family nucleoid-associated protein [Verrucomicrobiota bacterium]
MKKQARLMQEQLSQAKNKMESTLVEGSSGNGLVTVTLNGSKDLKKIAIKPEALTDVEGLQDLIIGAFEAASAKIEDQAPGLPGLPAGMNLFA